MDPEIEEIEVENDDYYAYLNLPRDASAEDITSAYRNLSRIYHPDKHSDADSKTQADLMFNRIKKAYEILSNPEQRAIYDSLGSRAISTEGWELIHRHASPYEIREEYERLKKEREERRLQTLTNPKGSTTLHVNATDIFSPYDSEFDEPRMFPAVEISGMTMFQSIEVPMSAVHSATLSGNLNVHNGAGNGRFSITGRRVINKGWVEVDVGAGGGLSTSGKLSRNLGKRIFSTVNLNLNFRNNGIIPGIVATLAVQLDRHTVGYLTYTAAGMSTSMSTVIERNNEKYYVNTMVLLGIPHSYVSFNYIRRMIEMELKLKLAVKVGTFGFLTEYGAEKKVSKYSSLHASVMFGVPTGVALKIRYIRSSQSYNFNIQLSEEIVPAAIFYATITPFIGWFILKKCILDPFTQENEQKIISKKKKMNEERIQEKKKEAESAISLMTELYARVCREETAKNGLIILNAFYGKFGNESECGSLDRIEIDIDSTVIDVKIPLQCLVKDSQLIIHTQHKSELVGFYDPCIGEEKFLKIDYKFRDSSNTITYSDKEEVKLPPS